MRTTRLAFTCGDPAGVGLEIIAKWLNAHPAEAGGIAVIGPPKWLKALPLHGAEGIGVGPPNFEVEPGQPSIEGARVALSALERAASGTISGNFAGVVTGPVSKFWLQQAGYPFPGQTEFFADRWGGVPTMAFCGGRLMLALLTWHIPLKEVPHHLGADEFARVVGAAEELARALAPSEGLASGVNAVRIGVCGLNPHAGEGGMLGLEEKTIIDPILDGLRVRFPGLSKCEPGDTLFARQLKGEFDVIVALYHDQGLGPLKTIDFDEAVNVSLGLPYVRTSPDHGTAFHLAGKGLASERSFTRAVEVAHRLIQARLGKSATKAKE